MPDPRPAITAPPAGAAIFLVVTINAGYKHAGRVSRVCGAVSALVRAVGARDTKTDRSCTVALGAGAWKRLIGSPRPRELHPFRPLQSGPSG